MYVRQVGVTRTINSRAFYIGNVNEIRLTVPIVLGCVVRLTRAQWARGCVLSASAKCDGTFDATRVHQERDRSP